MRCAFYDFQVSPYSYDIVQFLLGARVKGCDHVVFVKGDRGWSKFSDADEERKRFYSILAPLAGSYTLAERWQAKEMWLPDCYPEGYRVDEPVAGHTAMSGMSAAALKLHPVRPDATALEAVKARLGSRRPIVITLRDTKTKPERNANVKAWGEFTDYLVSRGNDVIVVPDTDNLTPRVSGEVWADAAIDVQIRFALYHEASLNMGVNNGPMSLVLFSDLPLIYLKPVTQTYRETSAEFWASIGLRVGEQPDWFGPHQRIVWTGDSYEKIVSAFEAYQGLRKAA